MSQLLIKKVDWEKCGQVIFMLMGACLVFAYYAKYAFHINTVWELPDEYGYLVNAAYLSGTEWTSLSNMYYGYGYSVLLLPFFLIGTKGTSIIRGAILINALCTFATYWVQIGLVSKLCKKLNKYMITLIAFVLSFYPYIMASNVKVLSESLLTLMVWLCGFALYKALETKHSGWYVLLAFCMAYTFFVHTRSFVFIGTLFVMVAFMLLLKEINWKEIVLLLLFFLLFFAAGYVIKNILIENVYLKAFVPGSNQSVTAVGNVVGLAKIFRKIKAFFSGEILIYLYSFVCKFFYLAVATVGTYQLGMYAIVKQCIDRWKKHKTLTASEWVKVYFVLASFMMICATTLNSPGRSSAVAFFFYGRYYEYLVLPVVAFGLEYFINCNMGWKKHLIHIVAVAVSGVIVYAMYQLIESQNVTIDIFRMSSFSGFTANGIEYRRLVLGYLVITILSLLIGAVLNYRESARWLFILILWAGFAFNNKAIGNYAMGLSDVALPDNAIIEYVLENVEEEQVYYLDGYYLTYTTRAQALLGVKKLELIGIEDLGKVSDNYLLVQTSSIYSEELSKFEKVMSGYYYDLYYIE